MLNGLTLKEVAGDIWLTTADHDTEMRVKTYGIRFIRLQDIGLKPTTYALQFLDNVLEKNVVTVQKEELACLLEGDLIAVDEIDGVPDGEGYVALRYADRVIGCGLYKNGTISSRIPKGRAQELRDWL